MRTIIGLAALALSLAEPAMAQPQFAPPPGPYRSQCSNIRMNGHFMTAWCRGARGSGESTINIESCSTPITVDPSGGLTCVGPGGGAPPAVRDAPPGYYTGETTPYGYGERSPYGRGYGERPGGRPLATLFEGPGYRGRPLRLYGPMPDLDRTGLNDKVRSIRLERRSGPWLVCTEANYGGRCVTVRRSTPETRVFGMSESISSVRPAW